MPLFKTREWFNNSLLLEVLENIFPCHTLVKHSLLDVKVASDALACLDVVAEVAEHSVSLVFSVLAQTMPL